VPWHLGAEAWWPEARLSLDQALGGEGLEGLEDLAGRLGAKDGAWRVYCRLLYLRSNTVVHNHEKKQR
jgi:hypothetical protein